MIYKRLDMRVRTEIGAETVPEGRRILFILLISIKSKINGTKSRNSYPPPPPTHRISYYNREEISQLCC